MAKFEAELPYELMRDIERLANGGAEKMVSEMLDNAADKVERNIRRRAYRVFKNPATVLKGLTKTKVYTVHRGDPEREARAVKVGFIGYVPGSPKTARYPKGTPIPLIAMAREYGTSNGEAKKPFVRPSFNQNEIEAAFSEVEEKYLPKED